MPDLNELRQRLAAAHQQSEAAVNAHVAEEQRVRALRQQANAFSRTVDENRQGDAERRDELAAAVATAQQNAARRLQDRRAALGDLASLTELIEPLTDPRNAIGALDARYPILLFPVRLETRFVMVQTPGAPDQRQLLIRVYPDECQVNAFEPDLSDAEVRNLRRYWCAMWSAGGDEGLQRAAWRELCAAHGAGRAMYLARQYVPLAASDAVPVRVSASEVILAIALDAPIAAPNEKNAIVAYWTDVWRAGSNATAIATALATLGGAVGNARAIEIDETAIPFNIKERLQPNVNRATVAVSVVFVVMTPASVAATKRVAWTRPPHAAVLPERFVLYADSGAEHIEVLGGVIRQPLPVGPDPLATEGEQFTSAGGDIIVPPQLQWLTDFEAAVTAGMGFRINLTPRQATQGFDRLYVLGVRLATDHVRGRQELQTLIQNQARSQSGFAIIPQGTATNNSEQGSSGWSRAQEADDIFDMARLTQSNVQQFDDNATNAYAKTDGLHLAEALGIDASVLQEIPNADGTDQAEARAMNAALWPATLGYWMDTQMSPVFGAEAIERTRRHFIDRVSGRGIVPAIRIGKQPYGILPTAAFSRMTWFSGDVIRGDDDRVRGHLRFLRRLHAILFKLGADHWDDMVNYVPYVGKPSDTPQQQLLDLLGLHPSSVEFHLNVLDSAEQIWNSHKFFATNNREDLRAAMSAEMAAGVQLLQGFGYKGPNPEITEKFFSYVHGPMDRPIIDTVPLSEAAKLSICTDDNKNYIGWCRTKAASGFDDLRQQKGFTAGKTPNALLYHMLRHALQLGYHRAAVDLHETNGFLTPAERLVAYQEPTFVHVTVPQVGRSSESRYRYLYAREEVITGSQARTVAEFIPQWIAAGGADSTLADQFAAMEVLEHAATASLERAFAEHIDLCGYRWDAWMLSLVNERLFQLRRPNGPVAARQLGLHLGAFGWLENLKPDAGTLPGPLLSRDLSAVFQRQQDAPLRRDPENGGHILAPSLNHAVTAAVLRGGYLGNAVPTAPDVFAVEVSSSRVRVALQFIEGIRNGQPLGALLGYQFERRLHDRHEEAEMDALIYEVRRAFPLASKKMTDSASPEADDAPIEQVEARNVCDGVLLLEHVRTTADKNYPWGKDLDAGTADQRAIIDEEVKGLFEIHDALADVAVSEAVHQVLMGNVDRGAASMDAFSKGGFPSEPDVVTTPRTGAALTHRVALHLPVDATAPGNATPRARAEPAIDAWLATILPPLANIVVRVVARNSPPASGLTNLDVDLASLGLRPIDIVHMLDTGNEPAMNELDDRIVNHVITDNGLCPDASVSIAYTQSIAGKITVFELAPLAASLRGLVLDARPLKPSDAALPNEASALSDTTLDVPAAQVTGARASLVQVRTDATALRTALAPLANVAAPIANVVAGIDAAIDDFVDLQLAAGLCGISLATAGGALRARREWFELVRKNADTLVNRWQERLIAADAGLAAGGNPANSNLMRVEALINAEREISTTFTTPIPNDPNPLLAIVNAKRAVFNTARNAVLAVKHSAATTIAALWGAWDATFAGRATIDLTSTDSHQEQERLRLLVRDLLQHAEGLLAEIEKRLTKGDDFVTKAATAAGEAKANLHIDAAKAFLGDGIRLVPRFTLGSDQGDEWQNAFDNRGNLLAHLAAEHAFPGDDWMHGVARVRPKLHDLESVMLLAGAFGTTEPVLEAVQFPYKAADPWLALELPAGFDVAASGDHVLYTASYPAAFDKTDAAFAGLLIDEWTEVIPAKSETAALAFHYDRPSHEPPQTMLLVTPAGLGDQWVWEDVRAAIPDTFELAKRRAVEPRQIAERSIARFLPATLMAFTTGGVSISSELRPAEVAFATAEVHRA